VEQHDVAAARGSVAQHPALSARDLLHLAICLRYGVTKVLSYDRQLAAAFAG
jgi:predicted nucleic acid-binding protein